MAVCNLCIHTWLDDKELISTSFRRQSILYTYIHTYIHQVMARPSFSSPSLQLKLHRMNHCALWDSGMCVCVYACMRVCVYVYRCIFLCCLCSWHMSHTHKHTYIHTYTHKQSSCVSWIEPHTSIYTYTHTHINRADTSPHMNHEIHVCVCMCVYVCMYTYLYVHRCILLSRRHVPGMVNCGLSICLSVLSLQLTHKPNTQAHMHTHT